MAKAITKQTLVNAGIAAYNNAQAVTYKAICDILYAGINKHLKDAENKIWHNHPVWFLEDYPIAGYSKLKTCIRMLFWSCQSFDEPGLKPEGSFKAAEVCYTDLKQINSKDLKPWLQKMLPYSGIIKIL